MPPQVNSRKRPAPGASPAQQQRTQQPQTLHIPPSSQPLTNDQFLQWGQTAMGGLDSSADQGSGDAYGGLTGDYAPMDAARHGAKMSTELTRRPVNQQLVARATRPFDNVDDDSWAELGDDMQLELRGEHGLEDEEEELQHLLQRAQAAKRDAQAKRKQIPPFVQKLSSFLDKSRNTDLIRWSDKGDSFIVLDEEEFARTLIPELFKHNNYASFVRQLNMYGFHKRVRLSDNSMRASERKNKSPSEYFNPFFRRGRPELLWLINKPKNPKSSAATDEVQSPQAETTAGGVHGALKAGQAKKVLTGSGGSVDVDGKEGIGLPSGSVVASERDMSEVRQQLQAIQQQQRVISSAINRLRKDQNQVYEQAVAFQALHDRHENSINAILTFLATVYNRSLEGHGAPDFANLFSSAIPSHTQNQGNVVDVGDDGNTNLDPLSRFKRTPLLLGAPPAGQDGQSGRITTESPAASTTSPLPAPQPQLTASGVQQAPREESSSTGGYTSDSRPAQSPQVKAEVEGTEGWQDGGSMPQRDIMSMINNANAKIANGHGSLLDFPAALSHYQNANGNSPLTAKQRSDMLSMLAQDTNAAGGSNATNNALTSPNPPPFPDMAQLSDSRSELDKLVRMQAEQNANVQNLTNLIQPLSPTGSILGLADGLYDGANGPGALELDQIFNSSDYFANPDGAGGNGGAGMDFGGDATRGFDDVDDAGGMLGLDGTADEDIPGGSVVSIADGSEAASPANVADESPPDAPPSPSKRRRRR